MNELQVIKKREPILEQLSLPVSKRLKERYQQISRELDRRELTKLHDLTRAKIGALLDEIEQQLGA
jgi:hypothetical protein